MKIGHSQNKKMVEEQTKLSVKYWFFCYSFDGRFSTSPADNSLMMTAVPVYVQRKEIKKKEDILCN